MTEKTLDDLFTREEQRRMVALQNAGLTAPPDSSHEYLLVLADWILGRDDLAADENDFDPEVNRIFALDREGLRCLPVGTVLRSPLQKPTFALVWKVTDFGVMYAPESMSPSSPDARDRSWGDHASHRGGTLDDLCEVFGPLEVLYLPEGQAL